MVVTSWITDSSLPKGAFSVLPVPQDFEAPELIAQLEAAPGREHELDEMRGEIATLEEKLADAEDEISDLKQELRAEEDLTADARSLADRHGALAMAAQDFVSILDEKHCDIARLRAARAALDAAIEACDAS